MWDLGWSIGHGAWREKSEVRDQRSEIGGQMTEDRRQKTAAYQPLGTFVRSKESESRNQEKETKVTHLKLLPTLNP